MRALLLAMLAVLLTPAAARADVVLLVEEPINFLGLLTYAGHSALLTDRLCSDNHVKVRLCRAGEYGTVISRYQGANGYDWLAMDPVAYLYAVDSLESVPGTIDLDGARRLRERYRETHQSSFPRPPRTKTWEELVGASYRRRIILIRLHTTERENLRLMAWLNEGGNHSHFNLFFSNCSDFVRRMLDVVYPGSTHRDLLFDAGITTPKQLAASMHHYAERHPEVGYEMFVLPQVPGNIPRSRRIYGVTESFVKTKPYLLSIGVLQPLGIGSVAASGLGDLRYNVRSASEKAEQVTDLEEKMESDHYPSELIAPVTPESDDQESELELRP